MNEIYKSTVAIAVKNRAIDLFGDRGFFVTNIVNDGTCIGTAGQKTSQKYMDLVSSLKGTNAVGTNFPICGDSYAGALAPLAKAIVEQVNNSVVVNIPAGAEILSVSIVRGDTVINVKSDQYAIQGNRIDLVGISLQGGDKVRVSLKTKFTEL